MNKIQFQNPDGIYSVTVDGIEYKVEIIYAVSFSIQDATRYQLGTVRLEPTAGEYIEVVSTQDFMQTVVAQTHVNNFEHGIYDSDCILWAIAQLNSDY